MSPVFCSVAKSPSSAPVRRDVPVISGVDARIFSTMCSCRSVSASAVPPGRRVVEDERAFVHLREESRFHELVGEDAGADEHDRDDRHRASVVEDRT